MEGGDRNSFIDPLWELIVKLRRGIDVENSWEALRVMVELNLERVCRELNTRQLVSVCDTYADFGDPLECRNAMLVSLLANMEKVAQSYLMWRLNYQDVFEVPGGHSPRKLQLWDGMTSFHLDIGDVTNSFFARLDRLISATPVIDRIYHTVVERMKDNPTVLGTLNRRHRHVFEPHTRWRRDPAYDRFRRPGCGIPPWKRDE